MMGTENNAPAMTLSPMPRSVSSWRRETFLAMGAADSTLSESFFGSGISVLLVYRLWVDACGRVRLAGRDGAMLGKPGDHIGHLCRGERAVSHAVAPVGMAAIAASGDDGGAQILIADEREIRGINNRTVLCCAFAIGAVTCGAERGENFSAATRVAW